METSYNSFLEKQGYLLKKARKKAGFSQANVAKTFNLSQDCISKYERGKTPVTSYQLMEFSKLYKTPITMFYMIDLK